MKDLTFETLLAVFEEMFGKQLFWAMLVVFLIVAALFIGIIIRDRKIEAKRLVRSELWAPLGAVIGIGFVLFITDSALNDIGGPIDVIMLILIGTAGAVGLTIFVYIIQSLFFRSKDQVS